jgi:hypothetical protein
VPLQCSREREHVDRAHFFRLLADHGEEHLQVVGLAERIDAYPFVRTGPGSLLLDYGQHGRFRLDIVPEPQI